MRPASLLADRYALEHLLGTGGMASVWAARDERLGRRVAIKVISDALVADAGYLARFEREARVAASLTHQNLVQVLDFATGERPFLVMEHIPGGSLTERRRREQPLPPVRRLAHDVLSALGHVHEAGIVHRDVKPGNVLVGDDGRALLTDFGIAQAQDATSLTATGHVVGTLRYLAPEVAEGQRATERSDLYSCGVLLREYGAGADPGVRALVDRLTDEDPRRRPASAPDALAQLEDDEQHTPATASTRRTAKAAPARTGRVLPGPDGRRRVEVRLGPVVAAIIVALLVVLVVAVAGSGGGGDRAAPAPAPRDAPVDRQLDALERAIRDLGPARP